ncbi:hypothetical protein Tco_1242873, partial [Tanacetum coccineum]
GVKEMSNGNANVHDENGRHRYKGPVLCFELKFAKKIECQYVEIVESEECVRTRMHVDWNNEGACFIDDYDS